MRLPDYVPVLRLEDSIAIEGEADPDADLAERDGASEAGFVADRKSLSMHWARSERDYSGSLSVAPATTSTATITIRLHTAEDVDEDAVAKTVDQAVSRIRSLMTRR